MQRENEPSEQQLEQAFERWSEQLGASRVDSAPHEKWSSATFPTEHRILGAVRPGSKDEVVDALAVARDCSIPVYPISRGRNSGFGSTVPPGSDAVLFDLRRMDDILEVDPELGYVTVQPGVSRMQLRDFLEQNAPRLMYNQQTGWPDSSIVGNALERGVGVGPDLGPDRPIKDLEVVTGEGRVIHTGLDRFPDARAFGAQSHPPGPGTTGLFVQSNLGIVTKMTLWLARKPEDARVLYFEVTKRDELLEVLDRVRTLLMDRIVDPNCCQVDNPYRRALGDHGSRYPWSAMRGETPLDVEDDEYPWTFRMTVLSSDASLGKQRCSLIKESLASSVDRAYVNTPNRRRLAELLEQPAGTLLGHGVQHLLEALATDAERLRGGIPREDPQQSLQAKYWRKREPAPEDPDPRLDGVGMFFIPFVLPNRPNDILYAMETYERIILDYDFEPFIAAYYRTPRSVTLNAALIYDRDVPGADDRAVECYESIYDVLTEAGYYPYRLSIHTMNALPEPRDDWGALVEELKRTLDPQDIIAPGRYDFRSLWKN